MSSFNQFEQNLMRLNKSIMDENEQLHIQLNKVKFLSGVIFAILLVIIIL